MVEASHGQHWLLCSLRGSLECLRCFARTIFRSMLLTAGVACARGLATALSDDADNALVVISAKGLKPRLQVKELRKLP